MPQALCPKCGAPVTLSPSSGESGCRCPVCSTAIAPAAGPETATPGFGTTPLEPADPDAATRAGVVPPGISKPPARAGAEARPSGRVSERAPSGEALAKLAQEVREARADPKRIFGPFVLLSELGKGGMGVVYRAWNDRLRRVVALKTILPGADVTKQAIQRFQREAEAIARLRHPNIVSVHEAGELEGKHYIAMDFIAGRTLDQRLSAKKGEERIPLTRAIEVVRDIARAVEHAHEQGVIHRDLKPQNILLTDTDYPFVLDFGLASIRGSGTKLTKTGMGVGTPAYMPPEQANGDRTDERSDVYSLGATLYHVLTGRPPFHGLAEYNVLVAVLTRDPVSPGSLNPRVAGDLETICMKCLEKEPDRRYESGEALADDLDRHLRGEPISARPLGSFAKLVRRARQNKLAAALVVLLAIALVGGGVAFAQVRSSAREALVNEALSVAETSRAAFEAARAAPVVSGAEASKSDELLALGLKALQAENRVALLVPGDAAARKRALASALALSSVARSAEQWSLAQAMCEEASELRSDAEDDERVKSALALVKSARTKVRDEHRALVSGFLDRARSGELASAESYDEALHALTALREPETVALLGKALDEVTAALGSGGKTLDPGLATMARLACDALGWLRLRAGSVEPLARYLRAETDEVRAAYAGQALCRLGGKEAAAPVLETRDRFGANGPYWGQVARVVPLLGVGLAVEKETAESYFQRGQLRASQGKIEEAIADFTKAIELDPRSFGAFANRGSLKAKTGDMVGALADLDKALELKPGSAAVLVMRGDVRYDRGDAKGAGDDYASAIRADARFAPAYMARGILKKEAGDLDGAIEDYAHALEIDPRDAQIWANRALTYHYKGDETRAIADFEKALELDPRSGLSWMNCGIARRANGDFDGAIRDETRAIELDQKDAWAYLQRAIARRLKEDRDGALSDADKAIELAPRPVPDASWAPAWRTRGKLREEKGDAKGAVADYEAYLKLAPDASDAEEIRSRVAELGKK